jgi:LysR family transcriptional regulator for metE and metH
VFLELRHLQTLVALREADGLVGAAERLHLTQSALSHQIKYLEERCGGALFARKSRPLRFTALGRRLLTLAEQILPEVDTAERDLVRLSKGQAGRLFLAIDCHSCFDWLMPSMDAYREQWPEVELDLSLAHAFNPVAALKSGEIDLVISSDPVEEASISYTPLFHYESVLVLPKAHGLLDRDWISPVDLAYETLITYPVPEDRLDIFRAFLKPAKVHPLTRRTAELTSVILQLVANGRGVAALPEWAIEKYLERDYVFARRLGEHGLKATLYAACRAEESALPYQQAFVRVAREVSFQTLHNIEPVAAEASSTEVRPE